jgi:hypothetical protein
MLLSLYDKCCWTLLRLSIITPLRGGDKLHQSMAFIAGAVIYMKHYIGLDLKFRAIYSVGIIYIKISF